jgi:soluble lytic murein transglycosylase-like protein
MSGARTLARDSRILRGLPVHSARLVALFALTWSIGGIGVPSALRAQDLPPESGLLPSTRPTDPLEGMLRDGFALTASRELARRLAEESSPDDILLAARAAASARAWPAVLRLLTERPWLDTIAAGEGRLLIAQALNRVGDPAEAVASFELALTSQNIAWLAPSSTARMEALVGLAEAYIRTGRVDEATARYAEAAMSYPSLRRWLLLSALQATARSGDADQALEIASVLAGDRTLPRDSIWVEVVRSSFLAGDSTAGLSFSDSLGARTSATVMGRWIIPTLLVQGDTTRAIARARRALATGSADAATGDLLAELDPRWQTWELVGEADRSNGNTARAIRMYERAVESAPTSEKQRLTYEIASTRFRRGEYIAVDRLLRPWIDASPQVSDELTARALFLAGRARYRRGRFSDSRAIWDRVVEIPGAPDGAYAAFMIGDMAHDAGRFDEAISAYGRTVSKYPRSSYAGTALFRTGMLAMLREDYTGAAGHFDTYRRRSPGGNWYHASIYWSAQARDAAGDSAAARSLYREALGYDPLSYYGIRAGQALDVEPWDFLDRRSMPPLPTLTDEQVALVHRMNDLRALGWRDRALRELSRRERAGESQQRLLSLATGLNENGWTWQGTRIASQVRAARGGLWSEPLLRAIYPLIYAPVLRRVAREERLDPSLVAAVIRRESQFDRDVQSPVGATGLMQLMPATAAETARRVALPEFRQEQVRVPEINMTLGARYLRDMLDRYGGSVTPALISYNAGPHRYVRWREYPEFQADAELMIERIPFSETRIYVKTIMAYRYIYRRLWGLGVPDESPLATF